MKKIKSLFLILFISLILCGCSKEKDYGLIELSGTEFANAISTEEELNITFAVGFSRSTDNYDEFVSDLEKVANRTKEYIYYVDYDHMDFISVMSLETILSDYVNAYVVIQNGNIIVNEEYSDYETMYKSLNGKKYNPTITYTSDEDVEKYFNQAKEDYEAGLISSSYSYLGAIWNKEEAKKYYEEHELYNIVHSWVSYIPKDDDTYDYLNLQIGSTFNTIFIYEGEVNREDMELPTDYKMVYYYIKDGYIYTSSEDADDDNYKKTYEINSLLEDHLYLQIDDLNVGFYSEY